MSDILDQSEVDALLEMVDGGEVELDVAPQPGAAADVSHYDFKRPERVSKEQERSLTAIHEIFARNLSAQLSGYLRTIVEVRPVNVEQLTFSEFIMSLPTPTCIALLGVEEQEGDMILELNPSIVFPVLERLLGHGKGDSQPVDRPLTEIEWNLAGNLVNQAMGQLEETWKDIRRLTFRLQETESNPQLLQVLAPNEPVLLISFETTMGSATGMMNLCIPYKTIEPLLSDLTSHSWFAYSKRGDDETLADRVRRNLGRAPVAVRALLAHTRLDVEDVRGLQVGDHIELGPARDDRVHDVVVEIEGLPSLRGRRVHHGRHEAVEVLRSLTPAEREEA